MKHILNFFYLAGLILGVWLFVLAFKDYAALNYYALETVTTDNFDITQEGDNLFVVRYEYQVGDSVYNKKLSASNKYYREHFWPVPEKLVVNYNVSYPNHSYLEGAKLEDRKNIVGIAMSIVFLLFVNLVYWLGNREKWIAIYSGRYEEYKRMKEAQKG